MINHKINNDVSIGTNTITSTGSKSESTESVANDFNNESQFASNFKCPTCEKDFANVRYYMGHIVEHSLKIKTGETCNEFKCQHCKKVYSKYDDLILHYASHVKGNKALPRIRCQLCGKLSAVGNLRQHMLRHVDTNQCVLSCGHCDKKFPTYDQLTRHKKIHDVTQKLACNICGREFNRKTYLMAHKNRVHPDEDSTVGELECTICQKKCKTLSLLKTHLYKHSLPEDQLCVVCGMRFRSAVLLRRHLMRADHNGVENRKFQCSVCLKRFYDKTQYTNHQVTYCISFTRLIILAHIPYIFFFLFPCGFNFI